MAVFAIRGDGNSDKLNLVHCKNEDRELQQILQMNPALLPGDQMYPDDHRRWLIIKREMPVPNPNDGVDRWSIDFLMTDQDAIPTFVECKRYADTRARREVVGQMLEYAANGHHYWGNEELRDYAEETAKLKNMTLDEALQGLRLTIDEPPDAYFERVQQNLRQGQIRLIFFLDESSMELRSIVDFLNKQLVHAEVFLVEARQYDLNGTRIVVPMLFGYTEQARMVKQVVTVTNSTTRKSKKWDEESYFEDASRTLPDNQYAAVHSLYDRAKSLKCNVTWGTGTGRGSYNIKLPEVGPRSLLTVYSSGEISVNYNMLDNSPFAMKQRNRMKELFEQLVGLPVPAGYAKRWGYPVGEWIGKIDAVIIMLDKLVAEIRSTVSA